MAAFIYCHTLQLKNYRKTVCVYQSSLYSTTHGHQQHIVLNNMMLFKQYDAGERVDLLAE